MIRSNHARRAGFTLIELLAVMAIIAILASLALAAYFRVRVSQEETASETIVSKLQSEFNMQWSAADDNARTNFQYPGLEQWAQTQAGDDTRRKRVIYTKCVMKLEFPQNFWEAVVWPPTMGLQPKSSYKTALAVGTPQAVVPQDPSTLTPARQYEESAVLLFIALTQGRRGNTAFSPTEHLGAHALGKVTLVIDPTTGAMREFDVFVDTWKQPIAFIRWPFGGAASDLNQAPHQVLNAQSLPVDPQDPERTLIAPGWASSQAQLNFVNGVLHPLSPLTPEGLNLTPVVMSSGRDKRWGLNAVTPTPPSPTQTPAGQTHFQRTGPDEDDNLYGYRIKGVSRR